MFVSASEYEGFGVATVEAMSAGTVVVATPVGAHSEIVQDNVNGFLTDPEATMLSQAIRHVLEMTKHELLAMGHAARSASRRFSWMNVAPQYENLYHAVVGATQR
jgi:alpha-1,3-mannosyltransferase